MVGTCDLVDCVGPVGLADLNRKVSEWNEPGDRKRLPYPKTYGWVIENARRLPKPVPYRHPNGAVIWVRLSTAVTEKLSDKGLSPPGRITRKSEAR